MVQPPVLALPNAHDEFILDTDASNTAIGGELTQVQNGQERVVAYSSYALLLLSRDATAQLVKNSWLS